MEIGLSQEELANKVGYSSRSSVNKIEAGTRQPQADDLVKFAKVLDTTVDYLLNGIEIERTQLRELSDQSHLFDYIEKMCGKDATYAIHLFTQLKEFDKGKVVGMMEQILNTYK
jgi:transcriptional regulator with XRE-family HTH domain